MKLLNACRTAGFCLSVMAMFTACDNDTEWKDVDGQLPTLTLTNAHEHSENGRSFKIAGKIP